jgi:hypothetical protein
LEGRRTTGWTGQGEEAIVRLDPAADAGEAGAVMLVRAAMTVVGDLQEQPATPAAYGDGGVPGPAVLGDVGERLGHHEVGGRLDGGRAPAGYVDVDVAGHPAVGRESGEPPVGQDRRKDAAHDRTQLGQGHLGGVLGAFEHGVGVRRVSGQRAAGRAQQ